MKMYRDEKTQGLPEMILFVEIFANVKRLGFYTFIKACKLWGLKIKTFNIGKYFYK